MTSTHINNLEQAVLDFQRLDIDDRLILLALLYHQFVNLIPLDNLEAIAQPNVYILVQQIQQLTLEEQLTFFSEALLKEEEITEEILLDTDTGLDVSNFYPTHQYRLFNSEAKLAFWYLMAENLEEIINDIPNEYAPTSPGIELFNFLQSVNSDQLVFFLQQVL